MNDDIATVSAPQAEVDLNALIAALDAGWNELPEEALRTCQAHRELVTPRLIEVLKEAVQLGREGKVRGGNAPLFALFLLTEFEAREALPVLLGLFALPGLVLDELLDDVITEVTQRVLAVLAGDQPDLIESLIVNRQINEYVRWEAASALCCLVRDGRMPREEAVGRLVRQLRAAIAAEDSWGVTVIVNELGDLNPLEVQEEIKAAFDSKLVDGSLTDWNTFNKHNFHPDQPGACPDLRGKRPSAVADTVEELRGWYCFTEEYRREMREYEAQQEEEWPEYGEEYDDVDYENDKYGGDLPTGVDWEPPPITIRNDSPRIGRNDPCPCGSGKKYKKCCLRAEGEF